MNKLATSVALAAAALLVAAIPASAGGGDTVCDGTFSGEANNIVVRAGTECVLAGANVHGNAVAEPGAIGLFLDPGTRVGGNVETRSGTGTGAFEAEIRGNFKCDNCAFQDVILTTVRGNVEIKGADEGDFILASTIGGNLKIEKSTSSGPGGNFAFVLLDNDIRGNVELKENVGVFGVEGNVIGGNLRIVKNEITGQPCDPDACPPFTNGQVDGNVVGGNLDVLENTGQPMSISGNQIDHNLECTGNQPAPVGGGNTAAKKKGQCSSL